MTKKDYILIASSFRQANSQCKDLPQYEFINPYRTQLLANLEFHLKNDNDKFNVSKFEQACLEQS